MVGVMARIPPGKPPRQFEIAWTEPLSLSLPQATLLSRPRYTQRSPHANVCSSLQSPHYTWLTDRLVKSRKYYERNNGIISHYLYIDRLLDSSLPHNLINDYDNCGHSHPPNHMDSTIPESELESDTPPTREAAAAPRVKRTPHNLYRIPDETAPLLSSSARLDEESCAYDTMPEMESHEGLSPEKEERLINLAIRINFVANVLLLASKVAIMYLTSSMSMLAGLVDGVLDFLSTVIVWVTTVMIRRQDRNRFPITRRRLEPLSVLIFSVIMVTSFFQVGLTSINRLMGEDHTLVELSLPSIILMAATVIVKLLCWLWCRLIPSPGVQVLAQDAMTDVIFNTFSIIFPLSMCPRSSLFSRRD